MAAFATPNLFPTMVLAQGVRSQVSEMLLQAAREKSLPPGYVVAVSFGANDIALVEPALVSPTGEPTEVVPGHSILLSLRDGVWYA